MADSLTGAVQGSDVLVPSTKDILTGVISGIDTTRGEVNVEQVGSTTLVQGNTSDGQTVAALVPSTSEFSGTINNGNFVANVSTPAGTGLTLQGPAETTNSSGAQTYFNTLIDSALPSTSTDTSVQEQRTSLQNAVNLVSTGLGEGQSTVVRVVNVIDNTGGNANSGTVVINGENGAGTGGLHNVLAVNTQGLGQNQTLALQGVSNAVIVGSGSVQVAGNTGSVVVGDNANQSIAGGAGSDTLVGGGGSDTLVGGSGSDTFGITSAGNYTVGDFNPSNDRLVFAVPGVTTTAEVASAVTAVTPSVTGTTYTFVGGSSITFTGLTPSDVQSGLDSGHIEVVGALTGILNPGN